MSPDELTREMQSIRGGVGWVVCDWRARLRRGGPSEEEVEAYVELVDINALGELGRESPQKGGWHEIGLPDARSVVAYWMQHDLAYELVAKSSQQESAIKAADDFFGAFAGAMKLFTNAATDARRAPYPDSSEWTPKTRHTFDRGVVVIDEQTIGLVWFADED